jgi:hypothetical protein
LSDTPVNQPPGGGDPPPPPRRRRAARKPKAQSHAADATAESAAGAAVEHAQRQAAIEIGDAHRFTIRPDIDLGRIWGRLPGGTPRETRVPVRRPDDLLVFDLLFDNLELAPDAPPRLVRVNANASAALIVQFPPQSFGEQAFLEVAPEVQDTDGETVPPLPSAKVRMSGPSRVVVLMPQEAESLDYTLAAVLGALRTWPMRLAITATPERDIGRFAELDRTWLKLATASADWAGARALVTSTLARTGAAGIEPAIADAARRLSDRAAAGLAKGDERLPETLRRLMQSEVDRLIETFPALRNDASREVAIASMSLAATEALSDATLDLGFSLEAVAKVPFLPIVLSPHEPPRTVTALELPYRLILSPISPARWLHADAPVEHRTRTELWHTRMRTAPTDVGPDGSGKVRAIWSPDYPITNLDAVVTPPKPFRMSLHAADRQWLVKLMSGFNEQTALQRPYRPRASREKRLHLSALGGLLDVEGNWLTRPANVSLSEWRHLAALGRDQYVRVVYIGCLAWSRHAAALVKVTERKFQSLGSAPASQRVAALRQRYFIVVLERVKQYHGEFHVFGGRNFPIREVEILTRVTPNLIDPGVGASALQPDAGIYDAQVLRQMVFWPMISSTQNVMFDIAVTDICGARTTFSMPLLFIDETANNLKPTEIKAAYNASANVVRRRAVTGGATICYAPYNSADKGDPRLPTDGVTFRAGDLTRHFPLEPNFYPEIEGAVCGVPAMRRLLGQPNVVVNVAYPEVYKQHGFGELDPTRNTGQVFLQLTSVHELKFGEGAGEAKSDALGALASPQMAIQGLSRLMGPVAAQPPADPNDAAQIEAALGKVIDSEFDPTDFFKGAKILGGIDLSSLLTVVSALTGSDVPKMLSRELPDRVEARFEWQTQINHSDPLNLFIPRADPGKPPTVLSMNGLMTTPLANPADTNFEATANLTNFKVNLFGFVILWFEALSFNAKKGQKPDVAVQLRDGEDAVQFGGPLEFVNELRNLIPSNGFSDPPSLTVTPSGISASFSINLPTVSVGVFSLSNASLGAGFLLPFDSKPAQVKFNFCERQHPFSLTVSFLGGGGFFAIGISTRGVNEIEAALEFGAGVAIDLGVASGSVEIKAGVYFHWLEPIPDQGSIELAGYVRLHGELCVLAIVSASLTFNLQIAYLKANGESIVWGEATLEIEIEILFFSASVSVKCRREFAGSKSDPKFIDLVPDQSTWQAYCEAFHEEAA